MLPPTIPHHHYIFLMSVLKYARIITPDSLKIASTSARLTSSDSKTGGLYPFLNHSFPMTSEIEILCFRS
uniref:Uncharacterized protein n=1 Tax=Nelumbo nucifera TaxID=4432 RepID=A0A822YN47_NELNU|nr:TPA_asm: hypothetical protein HUJ06_012768 [Nelumbo nucifera]